MDDAVEVLEATRVGLLCTVASGTSLVGFALLFTTPRRRSNVWLGAFLLLVGANFSAQALHLVLPHSDWARSLGYVALTLDPFALAYFASLFPRRSPNADGLGPLLLAVSGVFAAAEAVGRVFSEPLEGNTWRIAFFVYLAGCYLYAARRVTAAFVEERSSIMAAQLRAVMLGVLVVTLTRVALLGDDLRPEIASLAERSGFDPDKTFMVTSLGVRCGALLVLLLWVAGTLRRASEPLRRAEGLATLRSAVVICALIAGAWAVNRVIYLAEFEGAPLAPAPVWRSIRDLSEYSTYAIRWLVFCGAMAVGIVRYQALAPNADALATAGLAVGAAIAFVGIGAAGVLVGPWAGAAFGVAILGALAFAGHRILRRRHGVRPNAYFHERALEVYRAKLAATLADGGDAAAPELVALRAKLGLRPSEHDALLAIAQAEEWRGGPVLLGRYRVLRRLGAGSYATVHLVQDASSGRLLALKRLLGHTAAIDAAMRELAVAQRVTHPNLIAIEEVTRVDDGAIVVMEYADGGSLRSALDSEGAIDGPRARAILRQALDAVGALHDAGIVHGDLKPDNILLAAHGDVRVADFGAARGQREGGTLAAAGAAALGTPRYIAPEVLAGARATARSDLYAIGVLAGELLRDPTEPWIAWMRRMTAAEPSARFASTSAALAALPPEPATQRLPPHIDAWSEVQT